MQTDDPSSSTRSDGVWVRGKWVLWSGGLFGFAGFTTALIVAAQEGGDAALASTALGLAVLAFGVQLVIALAQFVQSGRDQREAARAASETLALVDQIRLLADKVMSRLQEENQTLLHRVVGETNVALEKAFEKVRTEHSKERSGPGGVDVQELVSSLQEEATVALESLAGRALWIEDRVRAEFVGWLEEQRHVLILFPSGGSEHVVWWGGTTLWAAVARSGDGLASPETFSAWLADAETVAREELVRHADQARNARAVLVLPSMPMFPTWQRAATEAGVVVVWPGHFDALSDAMKQLSPEAGPH